MTHSRKLDSTSDAVVAYDAYLEAQRATYISSIQRVLARDLDVTHSYSVTMNAIAAELSPAEALAAAQVPGIKSIRPAGIEYLNTYRGPAYIGASGIWDGTSTPDGEGYDGEGIKVGIVDGGSNPTHPSFANDASCGFSTSTPKLIDRDCSTASAGVCNGPNPKAVAGQGGHGVHTASTVAGNRIDNTVTPPPALPDGMTMSGVAPCAQIFQYKACPGNTCPGAQTAAGIENAIRDGVHVINFSISGGTSPWSSSDNDRRFLDAVNADVFVAASAGNNSSADPTVIGKVNHRGPWVMTVAASTQDQIVGPSLSMVGPGTPPVEATGVPLNPGSTTSSTPLLLANAIKTSTANRLGCTADGAFPAGFFAGSIAVVQRGICPFTEKITNAHAAGALAVVIANNAPGSINMDTTGAPAVPAYSVSQVSGEALIAFAAANPTATADLIPIGEGTTQGDVIADFSYRGPTPGPLVDLTKPDITAPGVDIYAATDPASGQYEFMSGTSMSGPHMAGAAALMRAVHPDWTPSEVKSAVQTTARPAGFMEDGETPWNIDVVGSGVVDLSKAAKAGLTLDETYARFLAANPAGGSISVRELNLASVRNMNCTPNCTFTRTVKNRLGVSGTWASAFQTVDGIRATVSPASFTLAPGATQELTITVSPPADTAMTQIGFGYLTFTEAASASPAQHFTVAIKGTGEADPEPEDVIFANGFEEPGTDPDPETGPVTMVLDDGTAENSVVWTDDDDLQQPSIWLNRFSPTADQFPMTLNNVQILWRTLTNGSPIGKAVKILAYIDTDMDGDPSNAVLVGQAGVTINEMDTFETYLVNINLPVAGDVYLGFSDVFAEGGITPPLHVAAIDEDNSRNRSWVAANDVGSANTANLGANDYLETIEAVSGGAISGNWMIRGNGMTTSGRPVALD